MAKSLEHGRVLDPHHGQRDIEDRVLRSVGSARARFDEDKLRAFRALRFAVTKGFRIDHEVSEAIGSLTPVRFSGVSTERIREELVKMFRHDFGRSFNLLREFRVLHDVVVERGIWFRPTSEKL
jgi:tRNA nucleotidyltransferase/poly(A) polymerase